MCTYYGKKYDIGEVFYDGCMRCKCDSANGAYSVNCVCKRGVYPGRYVCGSGLGCLVYQKGLRVVISRNDNIWFRQFLVDFCQ